jgi:hypothetical protein
VARISTLPATGGIAVIAEGRDAKMLEVPYGTVLMFRRWRSRQNRLVRIAGDHHLLVIANNRVW